MKLAVAIGQLADRSALVAAGVEESAELVLAIAHDHDGLPADRGGKIVVLLGKLGGEAEEYPSALEDVLHLQLEHARIAEHRTMDTEDAFAGLVVDQALDVGGREGRLDS